MGHSQSGGVQTPSGEATLAAMQARAERAEAALAAAQTASNGKLTLKVSEKGALSVYGLQKWPVTLYREQWARLIDAVPQIQAFVKANDAGAHEKTLARKPVATAVKQQA